MINSRIGALLRRPLVRRTTASLSAAMCFVGVSTMPASAHVLNGTYTQWAIGVSPNYGYYGDCTVWVGPVRDMEHAYPNYHKIAGVQVNCRYAKSSIETYVTLEGWNGSAPYQAGAYGYGKLVNSYGSGSYKKGSQPVCGGRNYYWRTHAWVRTNSGAWVQYYSTWVKDPSGC